MVGWFAAGGRHAVTVKYNNLPGIRSFHDFFTIKNPGTAAVMKVRENCYSGTLKALPMKLSSGFTSDSVALPKITDTYIAKGFVKQLADTKLAHLKQMCSNFILNDQWHEIIKELTV